jgi:hypothetical protein
MQSGVPRAMVLAGTWAAVLVLAASACGTDVAPSVTAPTAITNGPAMPTANPLVLDRLRDAMR